MNDWFVLQTWSLAGCGADGKDVRQAVGQHGRWLGGGDSASVEARASAPDTDVRLYQESNWAVPPHQCGHVRIGNSKKSLASASVSDLAKTCTCRRGVDVKAAVDASFEVAALLTSHASGTKDDDG